MGKWLKYLYALIGLTAAIGVVSGIGATCTTFFEEWWRLVNSKGGYSFAIVGENQPIFILCYVVTWVVAITWGILGWALRERKPWFYKVALVTSIVLTSEPSFTERTFVLKVLKASAAEDFGSNSVSNIKECLAS